MHLIGSHHCYLEAACLAIIMLKSSDLNNNKGFPFPPGFTLFATIEHPGCLLFVEHEHQLWRMPPTTPQA